MSKKTVILVLIAVVIGLVTNLFFQHDEIARLEKQLSKYEVDAVTKEIVTYKYIREERSEDQVYEEGYDNGYHDGYWDGFHDFEEGYEGFIDTDVFRDAYEDYLDALYE